MRVESLGGVRTVTGSATLLEKGSLRDSSRKLKREKKRGGDSWDAERLRQLEEVSKKLEEFERGLS